MAEDEGGHEHLLVLVLLDGDALPVVVDADLVLFAVDVHADGVHLGIADLRNRLGGGGGGKEPSCHDHPYLVVRGVDEDLIEYLVESRRVGDLLGHDAVPVQDPLLLRHGVHAADVGVGPANKAFLDKGSNETKSLLVNKPEQDVLEL